VKDVRRIFRKKEPKFLLRDIKVIKGSRPYLLRDLAIPKPVNMDSVYAFMKGNMEINTSLFNLNKALELNLSNACCKAPFNEERLRLIYFFFVNGVILGESEVLLIYLPY
jgi:hypothetical protein